MPLPWITLAFFATLIACDETAPRRDSGDTGDTGDTSADTDTTPEPERFAYRPFELTLELRARFRPPFGSPEGDWQWRALITTDTRRETAWSSLTAIRDPAGRGLLQVSPRDPRYLAFEDGSPYLAIGENMAWYDGRGTFAYDTWLERLAASGGTYIRVWMPSWAFGLEWVTRDGDTLTGSSLGDYTARLDRAWQLDYVLARAEALGIQVMLTIQNHGPFSTVHAGQWPDNPYNAANGGPLETPVDFFVDPSARQLFERRLRYIVARWGHHPNIFCWDCLLYTSDAADE